MGQRASRISVVRLPSPFESSLPVAGVRRRFLGRICVTVVFTLGLPSAIFPVLFLFGLWRRFPRFRLHLAPFLFPSCSLIMLANSSPFASQADSDKTLFPFFLLSLVVSSGRLSSYPTTPSPKDAGSRFPTSDWPFHSGTKEAYLDFPVAKVWSAPG